MSGREGAGVAAVRTEVLSRAGLAWRAVALVGGMALAIAGTAVWNDEKWPFAPMSQFAFYVGPQSEIRSTYIDAATAAGDPVPVLLSPHGVGIGRAEIEGRLTGIVKDPSLLQDIAERQRLLHPEQPQFATLWLRQRVIKLQDGAPVGTTVETLAVWQVRP
jgi:hypothetical protein